MFSRFVVPLLAVISLLSALLPMALMNPFRPQSEDSLRWAYQASTWSPWLTTLCFLVAVSVAWFRLSWRASRLEKGVLIASLAVILCAVFVARMNFFERMFSPLVRPGYVAAVDASHVEDEDLVMGIVVGGKPVAYPVSILAYHHLVNDRLADEPFVVTY